MTFRCSTPFVLAVTLLMVSTLEAQELSPVDVGSMSRNAFIDAYLTAYENQLAWTKTAFSRVQDGFEANVDTDAPLSETERAVPGCLYDAAETAEEKEMLGLQLAMTAALAETFKEDQDVDYVDVAFGDLKDQLGAFDPSPSLVSMMQSCNVIQVAQGRVKMTPDFWAALEREATERGYVEP